MPILWLLACTTEKAPEWTVEGALAPALAQLDTNHDGTVNGEEYARVAFSSPDFGQVDADHDGDLSIGELRVLVYSANPAHFFAKPELEPPPRPTPAGMRGGSGVGGPGGGGAGLGGPGGGGVGMGGGGVGMRPGGGGPGMGGPGGGGAGMGGGGVGMGPGGGAPGMGGPGGGGAGMGGGGVGRPGGGGVPKPGPGPLPDAVYALLILREEVISIDPDADVPGEADLRRIGGTQPLTSPEARAALGRIEDASVGLHLGFPRELSRSGGR